MELRSPDHRRLVPGDRHFRTYDGHYKGAREWLEGWNSCRLDPHGADALANVARMCESFLCGWTRSHSTSSPRPCMPHVHVYNAGRGYG